MIDIVFFICKVCIKKRRILCRFQICGCWLQKKTFPNVLQKTNWICLIESIFCFCFWKFWVVSVCFGLVLKQFCLFQLFRYRFKKHWKKKKKTKIFVLGFLKQTETKPKQILFRFISVENIKNFLFVSRTPYLQRLEVILPDEVSKRPTVNCEKGRHSHLYVLLEL